tara:strand:- start:282 stop:941 length:660 start_codon:yes stop_codon:yes gene_type:complete
MHNVVNNLKDIENQLNLSLSSENISLPKIIAVSKTFPITKIMPLIQEGHVHYGENKIQEAMQKWPDVKEKFSEIKLHMLGKVQTNKVKFLIPLFDYIHSLDNLKLAEKISNEQEKKNKKIKIFIQVNIGNEQQKNGINIDDLGNFYNECTKNMNLDIVGLMCLPPQFDEPQKYFKKMFDLKNKLNLKELSMGMSNDYLEAAKSNSTFLRIGSKIFGARS